MWLIAYQFPDMDSAGNAYQKMRDMLAANELEMSTYRVQIQGLPHAIAMGDGEASRELRRQIEQACEKGQRVELTIDVIGLLKERRSTGRLPGVFWEANYRPGRVARRRGKAS